MGPRGTFAYLVGFLGGLNELIFENTWNSGESALGILDIKHSKSTESML